MESRFEHVTEETMGQRIREIRQSIAQAAAEAGRSPQEIQLMAVTKTVPAQVVNMAIAQGITLLGGNRAQELCAKYDDYHKEGCAIHFIGGLQTNKVRQIIDKVQMIESVDSLHLAKEISRLCVRDGRTMDILLEVNIGGEESKGGVAPEKLEELALEISQLPAISIQGLMTIPPICQDQHRLEEYFAQMREIFIDMKAKSIDNGNVRFLSMGMSGDYLTAIRYGANIVRLGTALFGARVYH